MSARPPTSAMATDNKPKAVEIPEIVVDPNSKRRYERGRFLGKVRACLDCLTRLSYRWAEFVIIDFNIDFSFSGWICKMLRAEGFGDWRGKKFSDSSIKINTC